MQFGWRSSRTDRRSDRGWSQLHNLAQPTSPTPPEVPPPAAALTSIIARAGRAYQDVFRDDVRYFGLPRELGDRASSTSCYRKRNPATGETGAIGGPRQVVVEPIKGARHRVEIDFSTGYHLVDIVARVVDENGAAKRRSGIVVESERGIRRTILRRGETP